MGEHADDFVNDVIEHEHEIWDYKHGFIDNDEAYDCGLIDEGGYLYERRPPIRPYDSNDTIRAWRSTRTKNRLQGVPS